MKRFKGFSLWQLILIIGDGTMYLYDNNNIMIDTIFIGFTDNISDLDGNGERIVDRFERLKDENGEEYFNVFLSADVDENENGTIPVYDDTL